MMVKPPSKILEEAHKEFYTKKIKLNKEKVAELAKKTLLSIVDVQMWLEHLDEVRKNRVEGAKKAAAVAKTRAKSRTKAFRQGSIGDLFYVNFFIDEFSYLNITSIAGNLIQDESDCGFACLENPSCFSYNVAAFRDVNGKLLCELLSSDKYNNSKKFNTSKQFHHFYIPSPCGSAPCKNSAQCINLYEENGYKCVCLQGFTGQNCDTIVNDCSAAARITGIHKVFNNGSHAFPVYCDQTNDGGGWTMVFKAVKGVTSPKVGNLWNSNSLLSENVMAALDTTTTHKAHYKNRVVQQWEAFNPTEARVVLYENGNEVLSLKFNANGTNKFNWFSKANLILSPWTDLKSATNMQHFDITGSHSRYFEVTTAYNHCGTDSGWLMITGGGCNYETRIVRPAIQYSKLAGKVNFNVFGNVGIADLLAVFVR